MSDETRGQRIARLRAAKGWTRQQLATYSEVANNTIWRLENDQTENPHANVIAAIAAALDVSPEEIEGQPIEAAPLDHQYAQLKAMFESLPQDGRDQVTALARGLLKMFRDRE